MTIENSNPHFDKGPVSRRLWDIAAAAGSTVDLDVVLRHLYQAVLEVSGFDRVGLWLSVGTALQGT